jgi:hypothetical protein
VKLAEGRGRVAELEAGRAALEREKAEVGRRLAEEEKASALLRERVRGVEEALLRQRAETDALLLDSQRAARELVAEERKEREVMEGKFGAWGGAHTGGIMLRCWAFFFVLRCLCC